MRNSVSIWDVSNSCVFKIHIINPLTAALLYYGVIFFDGHIFSAGVTNQCTNYAL